MAGQSESWASEGVRNEVPSPLHLSDKGLFYTPAAIHAKWHQVFGAVQENDRVFILLARRPPAPPWIELKVSELGSEHPKTFIESLERRIDARGYRGSTSAPHRDLDEFFREVLAGQPIPGALEVPIGPGPGSGRALGRVLLGSAVALGAGAVAGPIASLASLGALGAFAYVRSKAPLKGRRVLVLAPDGCVVGLASGAKAFAWPQIRSFSTDARGATLRIEGQEDELLGELDEAWFDAPIGRVVAIAERYRRRRLAA